MEVARRVASGLDVPVRARRPEAPLWLVSVVERALATDPRRRYADAGALLRALESPGRTWSARRPLAALIAALVLLGGGLAVRAALSEPPARPAGEGPAADRHASAKGRGDPPPRRPRPRDERERGPRAGARRRREGRVSPPDLRDLPDRGLAAGSRAS